MVKISEFDSVCRLCLDPAGTEMKSLFVEYVEHSINLAEKVKAIISVKIEEGDERPSNICNKCVTSVCNAYNFKLLVEKNQALIEEALLSCTENAEIEESSQLTTADMDHTAYDYLKLEVDYRFDDSARIYSDGDWEDEDLQPLSIYGTLRKKKPVVLPRFLECPVCNSTVIRRKIKMHMMVHNGEKPHLCDICGKGFTWRFAMVTHKRVHTGEKPYLCKHCGMTFRSSSRFAEHSTIHTGKRAYTCERCPLAFRTSGRLKRHTRIHTGEKPFKCSFCARCFSERYNLKQHLRIHTGDKNPHICSVCNHGFARRKFLDDHVKLQHAVLQDQEQPPDSVTEVN